MALELSASGDAGIPCGMLEGFLDNIHRCPSKERAQLFTVGFLSSDLGIVDLTCVGLQYLSELKDHVD